MARILGRCADLVDKLPDAAFAAVICLGSLGAMAVLALGFALALSPFTARW